MLLVPDDAKSLINQKSSTVWYHDLTIKMSLISTAKSYVVIKCTDGRNAIERLVCYVANILRSMKLVLLYVSGIFVAKLAEHNFTIYEVKDLVWNFY